MKRSYRAIGLLILTAGGAALVGCANETAPIRPAPTMAGQPAARPAAAQGSSALMLERSVPEQVQVGKEYDEHVKVTNLTGSKVREVVISLELPRDGYELIGSRPQGRLVGQVLRWEFDEMAPGASQDILIRGRATQVGTVMSCADVAYKSDLLCRVVGAVEPMLRLTASAPESVLICDVIPITLVVSNPGSADATNVKVVQALPEGVTSLAGTRATLLEVGALAPGESRELTVQAKASRTGAFAAQARATANDDLSAEAYTGTTVLQPVLALSATGPATRYIGRPLTYNIRVANTGDASTRDLMVTDYIPAGSKLVSTSEGALHADGQVVWRLGTLVPGEFKTLSVTVQADQIGTLRNLVSARGYCAEASTAGQTEVVGIPAILLEVVDVADPVEVGGEVTYQITVLNQGSAADTNIRVTATLPPELQYVSSAGPTRGSAEGGTVTFAPLGQLAAGDKAVWRVQAKGVSIGDVRFTVTLNSDRMTVPAEETEPTFIYSGQ